MKKYLLLSFVFASLTNPAFAMFEDACDPDTQDCSDNSAISEPNKKIYPYKPYSTELIANRLQQLYEGPNYISNIFEMELRGLNKVQAKVQPWGGPYWPLYQGMVSNTYQDKDYKTFILTPAENLSWKKNVKDFKERAKKVYPKVYDLSEDELAKLSPTEKYDLLLGDTTFDLTSRIWNYAEVWGNEKKWGFLSAIDLPEGYRLPKTNKGMAFWEGICHGWAVAAGHSPRPEKTVTVTLPNGKKLPFYPNDLKALLSLMWANSTIQSNVIFEGNRCNKKMPDRDKYGRYIDIKKDRDDYELTPRCADVHPGIFHMAMVNILGVDGRSFVVDKTAEAAVANQPVSGYEITYFNPKTGKDGTALTSVLSRAEYGKHDPFKASRNPEATQIVGVHVSLKYTDWEFPLKKETNFVKDDTLNSFEFNYDLELNQEGKIVGGQWRVKKDGSPSLLKKTHQPDFFWVVPRDWKNYFQPLQGLPTWDFAQSTLPPQEFGPAARRAHSFVYEESERYLGYSPMCPAFSSKKGGDLVQVKCEFRYPRPQPLFNIVEKLVEESRK